jgi:hypothetical protein
MALGGWNQSGRKATKYAKGGSEPPIAPLVHIRLHRLLRGVWSRMTHPWLRQAHSLLPTAATGSALSGSLGTIEKAGEHNTHRLRQQQHCRPEIIGSRRGSYGDRMCNDEAYSPSASLSA